MVIDIHTVLFLRRTLWLSNNRLRAPAGDDQFQCLGKFNPNTKVGAVGEGRTMNRKTTSYDFVVIMIISMLYQIRNHNSFLFPMLNCYPCYIVIYHCHLSFSSIINYHCYCYLS